MAMQNSKMNKKDQVFACLLAYCSLIVHLNINSFYHIVIFFCKFCIFLIIIPSNVFEKAANYFLSYKDISYNNNGEKDLLK